MVNSVTVETQAERAAGPRPATSIMALKDLWACIGSSTTTIQRRARGWRDLTSAWLMSRTTLRGTDGRRSRKRKWRCRRATRRLFFLRPEGGRRIISAPFPIPRAEIDPRHASWRLDQKAGGRSDDDSKPTPARVLPRRGYLSWSLKGLPSAHRPGLLRKSDCSTMRAISHCRRRSVSRPSRRRGRRHRQLTYYSFYRRAPRERRPTAHGARSMPRHDSGGTRTITARRLHGAQALYFGGPSRPHRRRGVILGTLGLVGPPAEEGSASKVSPSLGTARVDVASRDVAQVEVPNIEKWTELRW